MTDKVLKFLEEAKLPTPLLVVDLDKIEANYRALAEALPDARIFYAMKANPAPEVMARLVALGCCFDVASIGEVEQALAAGASPDRLSFGNTIKKERDIARAYALGVRLFAFDAKEELEKLARAAPGSRVFCRILTSGEGADWPLSRKFGCTPEMAADLLQLAPWLGLMPFGVSFHVGSQQRDPEQWDKALATVGQMFRYVEETSGIELKMVNLGGGFPSTYGESVPSAAAYGQAIRASLLRHFGNHRPELIVEPGRGLVGDAGVIEAEVVLIAKKGDQDGRRWVYLDIGKFGGLAETMDEAIRYPIETERRGEAEPVVIAGPTCDSADVLYDRANYRLPKDLAIGDRVRIRSTGAYTTTYASVGFNGFEPLRSICI